MDERIKSTDDRRRDVSGIRHSYRTLSEMERNTVDVLKDRAQAFWDSVDQCAQLMGDRPGSQRSYALAKTKIDEAVFWAVHGVTNPEPVEASHGEG